MTENKDNAPATKEDVKKILAELEEQRQIVEKLAAKEAPKPELTKKEILRQFEDEHLFSSAGTRKNYPHYARMWLDFADRPPSQWDKKLINRYMNHLQEKGYAQNTLGLAYTIAKLVFESTGRTWPMPKHAAPQVDQSKLIKPTQESEGIKAMIQAAKDGNLSIAEAAYLALSTTYGLRREELMRVKPEHIDYKKHLIWVDTVKRGEKRHQVLAEEIVPYLKRYNFNKSYSLAWLSAAYLSIEKKAGLDHVSGSGWHSIRRAIDSALVPWDELKAYMFTRWKLTGTMTRVYLKMDRLTVDREVLSGPHPFLPMWRQ